MTVPSRIGAANDFARWLNSVRLPVYAVDDERRIVFANDALASWAGAEIRTLLKEKCDYTAAAPAEGAAAVAAALCPPPEAFLGTRVVVQRAAPAGTADVGHVEFIPLVVDGTCQGVLAIVHATRPPVAAPPGEAAELHEQLQQARRTWRAQYSIGRIVGDSPAMLQVRAQISVAAASRAATLIVGPPGAGRRTIARTIHAAADPAAELPLLLLTAADLTGEHLRSQVANWSARFISRASGALLVTDVEDLPPDAQAELAALLTRPTCRFTVLATAREPLAPRVADGTFRDDLAKAIATITITLPPLARRRADIPMLAQSILEEHNAAGNKQLSGFTSDALDALTAYPWPGHVAELAKFVGECHAAADGPPVTLADLPKRVHLAAQATARPSRAAEPIELEAFLADVERELIVRALAEAKQNKSRAAKLLGLTRPRLYRRMVQLGLVTDGE